MIKQAIDQMFCKTGLKIMVIVSWGLAAFLALLTIVEGCSSGHPVPPEAYQSCIDSGGVPFYVSAFGKGTQFICGPKGTTSLKFN